MAAFGVDIRLHRRRHCRSSFTDSISFTGMASRSGFHLKPPTDGNAVIFFKNNNIVHTGDLFNGLYPFIDAESGATLNSPVAGIDSIMGRINDNTKSSRDIRCPKRNIKLQGYAGRPRRMALFRRKNR
jgi:hypothetical protein